MKRSPNACMAAGGRFDQCSNWVKFGLIFPPPKQHGAGRGSLYAWPSDIAERVSIIKDRLTSGYKLLDIAYELFVVGYTLHPKLIRKVLLKQLDEEEKAKGRRRHTRSVYSDVPIEGGANIEAYQEPNEQDEARERHNISRSLKRKTPYLSQEVQTALIGFSQVKAGVATPQTERKLPPYYSIAVTRQALQLVDDMALLQASINAVAYLNSPVAGTEQWEADLGVSSEQAARLLLPLYRGKAHLTHRQAARPLMTIIFACFPNWERDIAEQDQRVMRPILIQLVQEMKAAGRL